MSAVPVNTENRINLSYEFKKSNYVCMYVCVAMPSHCTIMHFRFHARRIDGIMHHWGRPHYVWDVCLYSVLYEVEVRVTVCVAVCVM